MSHIFVSYSRKNKPFAQRLAAALAERKREAWVDWQGIAPTAEWLKEIFAAIEGCTAFVFVCTPESLASEICAIELQHAVANKKRILPVVCRDIDAREAPPALGRLNWIFMRDEDDFEAGVAALVTAIDTDFEWVERHTRLLVRATEWRDKKNERSLLLRGVDLKSAEAWLALAGVGTRPDATALQRDYLLESRTEATRRKRWLVGASSGFAVLVVVFAVLAWFKAQEADVEAATAVSRKLAAQSVQVSAERADLHPRALLLAAESMLRSPAPSLESDQALRSLLAVMPRHLAVLSTGGARNERMAISRAGRHVAWSPDGVGVRIWTVGSPLSEVRSWSGSGSLSHIEFDPTGTVLLTVAGRKTFRLTEVETGRMLSEGFLADATVVGAAVAPRGEHVALLGHDGRLQVLGGAGQSEGEFRVDVYPGRDKLHELIRFSPDNRRLAVATVHGLRVCELSDLRSCGTPAIERTSDRSALEFSPDGKLLAVDSEGKIQVLDTEAQLAVVFETARPSGAVLLRFAPDGKSIATSGKSDSAVHVWNLSDKQPVASLATRGTVVDIAIAADSTRLAASLNDGTSQVWQLPSGEPLALLSHTGRLMFVGNGSTVLTAGDREAIHLWESSAQAETARLDSSSPETFTFNRSGSMFVAARAAASGANSISRWLDAGDRIEQARSGPARSIKISPDGRRAWVGHGDAVALWDLDTLRPIGSADHTPPIDWAAMLPEFKRQRCSYRDVACQRGVERLAVEGSVEVEAVAPDGEYAATSRVDGVARIWRAGSAQPLLSQPNGRVFGLSTKYAALGLMALDGFGRPDANKLRLRIVRLGDASVVAELAIEEGLREAVFSPEGERLLLVTDDYALRMIELTTGRPLWQLPGGKGIRRTVFSGDSRLLAVTQPAASDGSVDILDVATGNPVRDAIRGSAGASVMVLTLGDDGALLAVGEVSGGLAVHDTASGRQVMRASHNDQIVDIALSADHRLLATASNDGSTRIFDLRQGREVARIVMPSPPSRVRFSPSGRHLAISSADSVRLWPLRPNELVADACRRVPRDMSVDEWHLYLANDAPRACREAMTRLEQR